MATIDDITAYVQRGKSPKYADRSQLPIINQKCIRWHGIDKEFVKFVHEDQVPNWDENRYLQRGDLLWNSTGTGTIGRATLYRDEFPRAVVDSHVTIVRANLEAVDPGYLRFFVMSPLVQINFEEMQSGSTNQVELSRAAILEKEIPLAPLNEQRRIVEKIETLFARLDQGEAALRHTQQLLARYRQSVLKAAVTGALTADWRAQNAHRLEHGRDMLARILQTRRQTWQGRGKYQEPAAPDTTNLPELPEGWVWATLEQLCFIHNGDRGKNYPSKANFVANGVPFVNAGHLHRGKIIREKLDYISEGDFELLRAGFIQKNDILYCIRGSLGKFAISDIERGAIASSLVILRPIELRLLGYLSAYLECPFVREEISKYDNGTAQPNLSARDLAKFVVPLPGILEVDAIGQVVSDYLRESEIVALHCQSELTRSAALRQSILKDAFAGKLVPQDPNDEPAAELLARIRAIRPTSTRRVGKAQRAHAEQTANAR